jgi:hypothetical protein
MVNPFNLDGSNGQLLGTDGNNNIQFYYPVTTNKNIYNNYFNQNPSSGSGSLGLFSNIINGFTLGKKSTVEVAFSFFQDGTTAPFNIYVSLGGVTQTIQSFSTLTLNHLPYKVIFQFDNTSNSQNLTVTLTTSPPNDPQLFYIDGGDYISVNVYEF